MDARARFIVQHLADSLKTPYHGTSSMTFAVYDTAWVSMISKNSKIQDGSDQVYWLFPESFQALLEAQSPEGGFMVEGAQLDGILSTMAGLLAFCKHRNTNILGCSVTPDMEQRIESAKRYLGQALKDWDVRSTIHVGFEILVPSLLRLLREEGLEFAFPGLSCLMAMNKDKMDKIKLQVLYTPMKTTLLHSLESFVGMIDFNKTSHFLCNGSMMASPSSTAAFLMNSSPWNEEAEEYIRYVTSAGKGQVPAAFPTCVFEISWVMTTLLGSGFDAETLGRRNTDRVAAFLENQLQSHNGVTGFCPEVLADADDTAKSIYTLNMLGRQVKCEPMVDTFETPKHFKTYDFERSESFSANCNVLIALLTTPDPSRFVPQIIKCLNFLAKLWWNGKWSDKWNVEPQYSLMLFSEALIRTLQLWNSGSLEGLPSDLLQQKIPLITIQIILRTINARSDDGSWKQSNEITSYALLTLKKLANLPWTTKVFSDLVVNYIEQGTKFLQSKESSWDVPEVIWVEKTTYGSNILSETYCLAALKAPICATEWTAKIEANCQISEKVIGKYCEFFKRLPIFKDEPIWRLRASLAEGLIFGTILRGVHEELSIFASCSSSASTKYLDYIPFTWTTCNNSSNFGLSPQLIIDMMVISLLNFQVDKWFEMTTADPRLHGEFERLRALISRLFRDQSLDLEDGATLLNNSAMLVDEGSARSVDSCPQDTKGNDTSVLSVVDQGFSDPGPPSSSTSISGGDTSQDMENIKEHQIRENDISELFGEVKTVLGQFKKYIFDMVADAKPADINRLLRELSTFLQAHVTHAEDTTRLPKADDSIVVFTKARGTYYEWVHTTSADHTSCPYSYELFRCLLESSNKETGVFKGARALYLAQDLCRRLATMCRQYNDYGSINRDRAENNLNSVNFPEFHNDWSDVESGKSAQSEEHAKHTLLEIANYERECLELALSQLKKEVTTAVWDAMRVFVNVTDLYGQIYVVRDINA